VRQGFTEQRTAGKDRIRGLLWELGIKLSLRALDCPPRRHRFANRQPRSVDSIETTFLPPLGRYQLANKIRLGQVVPDGLTK
jgi:hypothetical protein